MRIGAGIKLESNTLEKGGESKQLGYCRYDLAESNTLEKGGESKLVIPGGGASRESNTLEKGGESKQLWMQYSAV